MSEIKDKLTKEVSKITETVSNEQEKAVVLNSVKNIIEIFVDQVVNLSERQTKQEEKLQEVFDMLSQIEEELIDNIGEELEAECPYCGEIIPFQLPEDDKAEFECPKCHNVIEMELMLDGHDECDCGHCHGDCGHEEDDECDPDDCEPKE